jgi:hypothetical protein
MNRRQRDATFRDKARRAVLAIYQTREGTQHYRTAFLLPLAEAIAPSRRTAPKLWRGIRSRANPEAGKTNEENRFLVITTEYGGMEPDSVGLGFHSSLEEARGEAVAWVGQPREVNWDRVTTTVETAYFNALVSGGNTDFIDDYTGNRLG